MTMWTEDFETDLDLYGDEDTEALDEESEDLDYESDGEDVEALTPAQRRRRAGLRKARIARNRRLQRLRAARAARAGRGRPRPTPSAAVASTREAVEKVDLESKVQADATASALATQARRADASENAAVASAVVGPLANTIGTFSEDLGKNTLLKTGLPLAPLLFLRPRRRGRGAQALISDKRVWAVGAVIGLTVAQRQRENSNTVVSVDISPDNVRELAQGQRLQLRGLARDSKNGVIPTARIKWTAEPKNLATVDPDKGIVTANTTGATGPVEVTATVEGTDQSFFVTLNVT